MLDSGTATLSNSMFMHARLGLLQPPCRGARPLGKSNTASPANVNKAESTEANPNSGFFITPLLLELFSYEICRFTQQNSYSLGNFSYNILAIGIAIISSVAAYLFNKIAENNESTALELWARRCYFGHAG
ncbi:hypothetical protein [Pseudomonas sp. NBRC 111124]|uniref:hypothetical protein n=1 Tax=Pseudomonas sp. NBRC 111124 TaxID=1661039 RepID=UPI0012E20DAD|nr:hypothetical protein [Pseudomonas sp. NBRC 111124]